MALTAVCAEAGNMLTGFIPPEIGNLAGTLERLVIGKFYEKTPSRERWRLTMVLPFCNDWRIADNSLMGTLPRELGMLTVLRTLDLGKL